MLLPAAEEKRLEPCRSKKLNVAVCRRAAEFSAEVAVKIRVSSELTTAGWQQSHDASLRTRTPNKIQLLCSSDVTTLFASIYRQECSFERCGNVRCHVESASSTRHPTARGNGTGIPARATGTGTGTAAGAAARTAGNRTRRRASITARATRVIGKACASCLANKCQGWSSRQPCRSRPAQHCHQISGRPCVRAGN